MWRVHCLRSLLVLIALLLPGLFAPLLSSHLLFILSPLIFICMTLNPSLLFLGLYLLVLFVGDSLSGLKLGTTSFGTLCLALSSFVWGPSWLMRSEKDFHKFYSLNLVIMMMGYSLFFPQWSKIALVILGIINLSTFFWFMRWVQRYLRFVGSFRHA